MKENSVLKTEQQCNIISEGNFKNPNARNLLKAWGFTFYFIPSDDMAGMHTKFVKFVKICKKNNFL